MGAGAQLPLSVGRSDVFVAAQCWHLAVLRWADEHDCLWESGMCELAAWHGHLELEWAHQHGCEWSETTCNGPPFACTS